MVLPEGCHDDDDDALFSQSNRHKTTVMYVVVLYFYELSHSSSWSSVGHSFAQSFVKSASSALSGVNFLSSGVVLLFEYAMYVLHIN